MSHFQGLTVIPAYYAEINGKKYPFIVTIAFVDADNKIQFPDAVNKSIDAVSEITGLEGLITAKIQNEDRVKLAPNFIEKSTNIAGIVLFHCWDDNLAEKVMNCVSSTFPVTLIQR